MKYLLIALLLAGAAWAQTLSVAFWEDIRTGMCDELFSVVEFPVAEYEIAIYGTMADGFKVVYRWLEPGAGGNYSIMIAGEKVNELAISPEFHEYHYETATFYVDSLADIKPTPEEMEP